MNELIQILLAEFREEFPNRKTLIWRNSEFSSLKNKIKVAIGMRRAGKTYFLYQTIYQLIEQESIPWQRFLYLNFEDDRLSPCPQQQFSNLLESFYRLYPENHDHTCYLFLDEIQYVENWPLVIRRFFDTKKVQLFISGSSAKLLSKEIATSLRGRSITTEIWPYSFSEYLAAHKIQISNQLLSQKNRDVLYQQLCIYLTQGGFPETIGVNPANHRQLLQDYTELVIIRDIIERYNITNISLLKYLIKVIIKNAASSFSVNKFANDIKSQGLSGSKNTIYDYLTYIEDAFLAFLVPLYSESLRQTHTNPRKTYVIDPGLIKAYSLSLNDNYGHLFENLIYLDLRRQGHKIYYYLTKERYEVDFLTEDRLGKRHLYQVVWDTSSDKTMARETRALQTAKQELQIEDAHIITPESYITDFFYRENKADS